MLTGGKCDLHSVKYILVESLSCIPETNTIVCINYISVKKRMK